MAETGGLAGGKVVAAGGSSGRGGEKIGGLDSAGAVPIGGITIGGSGLKSAAPAVTANKAIPITSPLFNFVFKCLILSPSLDFQ